MLLLRLVGFVSSLGGLPWQFRYGIKLLFFVFFFNVRVTRVATYDVDSEYHNVHLQQRSFED